MFKNLAAEFVYTRTYARWNHEKQRRENWNETVERFINFLKQERPDVPKKVFRKIHENILSFNVMPSMRALWSAGEAAKKDNTTFYNCAFMPVNSIKSFSECLHILCCGTGVGFSVENKYIQKLPIVQKNNKMEPKKYIIPDTKEGWSDSVKLLMENLYNGQLVEFDYSQIRPQGAPLKTMGGRASGSGPIILLHGFINEVFNKAQGRKLTSLECHDIMNKIAEIVVAGGVRRSSQISLSDLDDELLRDAKIWPFPLHRAMSNNSAVYYEKPSATQFLAEWSALASSGTGERGISNLGQARKQVPERRNGDLIDGFNPCHEIALRSFQFCNLSSVVIRPDDDLDSLLEKVETATWIGVIQSSFTKFPYLRKIWKTNSEDERLLGVSLSGQADNPDLLTPDALKALKSRAMKVAKKAAKIMNINVSAAITTVKPEGTSSQVVVSGSGLHPWYSQYFIRRYRIAATDPLYKMLKAQGVKMLPENGQKEETANTFVVSFPCKAPKKALLRQDLTALDQLEHYKKIQTNWCEHNASATIYVKNDEWFKVGNWVYENWDIVNGLSFLPYDGGHYEQAPYEEIDRETYKKMLKDMPKIDYSKLSDFEQDDNTEGAKTVACSGNKCELI